MNPHLLEHSSFISMPTQRQMQGLHKRVAQINMMMAGEEGFQPFNPATLRMALTAPAKLKSMLTKEKYFDLIFDSGATVSITNCEQDFIGPIRKPTIWTKLTGIARGLKIAGEGHVLWAVMAQDGTLRLLKLPALLIPGSPQRLLSTSSLLQTYPGETILLDAQKAVVSGVPSDPTKPAVTVLVNPTTNLPTCTAYCYNSLEPAVQELNNIIATVSKLNINLTESEKELQKWHCRLGHLSMRRIQSLMRSGVLAHTSETRRLHTAATKLRQPPPCAACLYGKQTTRPVPGKKTTVVRDQVGATAKEFTYPGQCVAVDHFICSTRGRLFTSRGKEAERDMYCGGCMLIDMATGFVDVQFQTNLTSHDTLIAVDKFERKAREFGVIVQQYLSDNGSAFTSREFQAHLQDFNQISRFAGAGAHHHNAKVERCIRTIMNIARSMMFHAAIHWPDMADPCLWPMAVQHAVYLYNRVPHEQTGVSPYDLFTRTRWPHSKFQDLHVWGCPVYCLRAPLANGGSIPR